LILLLSTSKKIGLRLLASEHITGPHLRKKIRLPHHRVRMASILVIVDVVINIIIDKKLLRPIG
jgi:hypothetical protein